MRVSAALYLATGEQLIPTSVHETFNLLTCPITHVPICPLTVEVRHVRADASAWRARARARKYAGKVLHAATLSELSERCFLESSAAYEVHAHNRQSSRLSLSLSLSLSRSLSLTLSFSPSLSLCLSSHPFPPLIRLSRSEPARRRCTRIPRELREGRDIPIRYAEESSVSRAR
jgi:hypothetical protein